MRTFKSGDGNPVNRQSGWVPLACVGMSLLTYSLLGCGSKNSSPLMTSASGGRSVRLFVTDSFREDVDQVFLTIAKVELIAEDSAVVVYDDPNGHQFDAKSLRDSSGQIYNFLASATIPSRLYTAVRVTLAGGFTITPKDQLLTKTLPVDDSFPRDAQGRAQIQFPLATPRDLSVDSGSNAGALVIDVDLANFRYNGANLVPAFAEASASGIADLSRQQNDEYRGTIANLTASQFDLTLGNTRNLLVTIAPDAVIFGEGGTGRSLLASGQTVEAIGKLDIVSGRFIATEIRTVPTSAGEVEPVRPQANGTVTRSELAGDTGTITLRTAQIKGFQPVQATVQVVTNGVPINNIQTIFIAPDGSNLTAQAFYAALSSNPRLYVEGAYDATTNQFTANIVKLQ